MGRVHATQSTLFFPILYIFLRQFFDLATFATMEPDEILDKIEQAMSYIPPVSTNTTLAERAFLRRGGYFNSNKSFTSDHSTTRPSYLNQHHISIGHLHDDSRDA